VEQPHTSAGRVPTHQGYRYYVDHCSPARLRSATRTRIESFFADVHRELSKLLQTFASELDAASTHRLKVTMQGAGIDVSVDGTPITSYGFNAALVDGGFGLMVLEGTASFDDLDVRTNDAQFADEQALLAAGSPSVAYRGADLTREQLDLIPYWHTGYFGTEKMDRVLDEYEPWHGRMSFGRWARSLYGIGRTGR